VWSDYESAWNELTPLQQAVLEVMAERTLGRQPFSPFTEQTLVEVSRKLEQAQAVANVNTANVQKALEALRDKGWYGRPIVASTRWRILPWPNGSP
jgi:hypothetical protein